EHLAWLLPLATPIVLHTLHSGNEVGTTKNLNAPPEHKASDRELKMAEQLVESLASSFDPGKYHDEYRDCVMEMIQKKAHGEEIITQPTLEPKPVKGGDLMAAPAASLAEARTQAKGHPKPNG